MLIQSDFFGNKDLEYHLFSLIKGGNLPNVLLFSGIKGVGKATLAYNLCQVFFQNVNKLQVLSNENLLVCISDKGNLLNLDCVKSIRSFIAMKSVLCSKKLDETSNLSFVSYFKNDCYLGKKIVIVDSIDSMNVQSQNALLKTIEETKNVFFILISHQISKVVLPVVSCCSKFLFKTLSYDDLFCVLKKNYNVNDYDKLERLIPIFGGSSYLAEIFFSSYDRYFVMLNLLKKSLLLSNKITFDDLAIEVSDFAKCIIENNEYYNFTLFYDNFWVRIFNYLFYNDGYLLSEEFEIYDLFTSNLVKNFYFNHWIESRDILQNSLDFNTNRNAILNYVIGKVMS